MNHPHTSTCLQIMQCGRILSITRLITNTSENVGFKKKRKKKKNPKEIKRTIFCAGKKSDVIDNM